MLSRDGDRVSWMCLAIITDEKRQRRAFDILEKRGMD